MQYVSILQLLILVTLANGAPVIAKRILANHFAWPLDGNLNFIDGRPLFGPSKTIRGVLVAVLVTTACAPLLGLEFRIGLVVGATAMAGDLFSSFVKRRLGLPPSSRATGLDQIPESLFSGACLQSSVVVDGARHCGRRRNLLCRRAAFVGFVVQASRSRSSVLGSRLIRSTIG